MPYIHGTRARNDATVTELREGDAMTPARTATSGEKQSAGKRAAPRTRRAKAPAASYPVKDGEHPWSAEEIAAIRATIESDMATLREEISLAEREVASLMRQSGDGAGDDEADAGSKTFEREQEMSLANNAREMLLQDQHAIERIDSGTYGICESCGQAIGKLRLEAAPRATLCVPCKSKQERR